MSAEQQASGSTSPEETNGKDPSKNDRRKPRKQEDEVPIEELYDLTQPIPRVEKPNKEEHDKELQVFSDEIEAFKAQRTKLQETIDETMNGDPAERAKFQEARTKVAELKKQKAALIDEKKAMRTEMEQARNETEKLMKDKKDVRSGIKDKLDSMEAIDKEIAKLQRKQETTTMSLNEEKRLIKDMDALQASKKFVTDLKAKDSAMDGVKERRQTIQERIKSKDKEIDSISKEIDEIMAFLKEQNDLDNKKRENIQGLFNERDSINQTTNLKIKQRDAARNAYRDSNNKFYNYMRAVRAQKKMAYEEEKKKREEERLARFAESEAEEAKKIPYEEEQELCEFLANYLERTYLGNLKSEDKQEAKKGNDIVIVEDNSPFKGIKPRSKKDDEAEEYFGKGKGKGKKKRNLKKQDVVVTFKLSADLIEQFSLVTLSPPTSLDSVANSVKELREKKEWYKNQPRGSVPTAADIRKNKENASKQQQQAAPKPKNSSRGGFALTSDDFVPLNAAVVAGGQPGALNASWGKQPTNNNDGEEEEQGQVVVEEEES